MNSSTAATCSIADGHAAAAAGAPAPALLAFCQRLPKIELHAHLNGCIRDATLRELAAAAQTRFTGQELDDIAFKGVLRCSMSAWRMGGMQCHMRYTGVQSKLPR